VLGEDSLAVGVPFNLPSALPSGSLKSEVDSADAGEEAPEGRHVIAPPGAAAGRATGAGPAAGLLIDG
jgi:hypothetical protein